MRRKTKTPTWFNLVAETLPSLLGDAGPRIVDVGAAGTPAESCRRIASVADYVAFDPDLRSPIESYETGFRRSTILNKAISPQGNNAEPFYLTSYPECSSLLTPNMAEVDNYTISGFFDVIGQTEVPAMSLNQAIKDAKMETADWLKLDTQGVDLRILQSLETQLFQSLFVVEMEPGISSFYRGESSFTEVCEFMTSSGFWIARMDQQKFPRLSKESISALELSPAVLDSLPANPFALELQFLRTAESWLARQPSERDAAVFWLIAMANGHTGFAFELLHKFSREAGNSELAEQLLPATLTAAGEDTEKSPNRAWGIDVLIPPILLDVLRSVRKKFKGN